MRVAQMMIRVMMIAVATVIAIRVCSADCVLYMVCLGLLEITHFLPYFFVLCINNFVHSAYSNILHPGEGGSDSEKSPQRVLLVSPIAGSALVAECGESLCKPGQSERPAPSYRPYVRTLKQIEGIKTYITNKLT